MAVSFRGIIMSQANIHPTLRQKKPEASFGQYTMLRCLVALAHQDGVLDEQEITYITAIMNRLSMSDDWRKRLMADFDEQQDIFALFAQINEPQMRANVLYFARILAYKDGVLTGGEEEILDKLHAKTLDPAKLAQIKEETRQIVQKEMLLHDLKIQSVGRPQRGNHPMSWFAWLDELLMKLGIDLLD